MATKFFKAGWTANYSKGALSQLGDVNIGIGFMPIGDFNGDGHVDILVPFSTGEFGQVLGADHPTPGRMLLLLGDGKGKFANGTATLPNAGDFDNIIRKYAVADFNGDGKDDVAMSLNWESGRTGASVIASPQIALLSQDGHLVAQDLGFTTWGHAFAAGDINGDGRLDFIIEGFSGDPVSGYGGAAYLQNADGTLTQHWLDDTSGSTVVIGDFDGDGQVEFVDTYATYDGNMDIIDTGMRLLEVDDEGDIEGAPTAFSEGPFQFLPDTDGTKHVVRMDASGSYYSDGGLQELKSIDINNDGRLDLVGVRSTSQATVSGGVVTLGQTYETHLEFFSFGAGGMEKLNIRMDGGADISAGLQDYQFLDWNGDGHKDIVITRWAGVSPEASPRVFLNDGAAHFSAIKQSLLPTLGDYPAPTATAVLDANEDGIMDIYFHSAGWNPPYSHFADKSDVVMLGTKKFYTGPNYTDPALKDAAGFNEQYYLHTYADAKAAVKAHKYKTGLDHYLDKGKDKGYFGFAVDTHIFGSDGNDTIKAREGEERLDGGLGNDKLTGGASSDTFVFSTKLGATNIDTIKDFKPTQGDLIALDHDIFRKVGAALDAAEFYAHKGAVKAHDSSDRIIYDTKTGKLYYDDDGNKKHGHDAIHFATLSTKPPLHFDDFTVV